MSYQAGDIVRDWDGDDVKLLGPWDLTAAPLTTDGTPTWRVALVQCNCQHHHSKGVEYPLSERNIRSDPRPTKPVPRFTSTEHTDKWLERR